MKIKKKKMPLGDLPCLMLCLINALRALYIHSSHKGRVVGMVSCADQTYFG